MIIKPVKVSYFPELPLVISDWRGWAVGGAESGLRPRVPDCESGRNAVGTTHDREGEGSVFSACSRVCEK